VYGFAKQSGGHVRIDSAPGQGTAVTLFLPRAAAAAQQKDQPVSPAQPASSAGEMVLVVEDDPDVRAYSIEILRELGYATLEAPDAKDALAVIRREPAIVLLFSDLGLPGGMNGRQLAEEALRLRPSLKILLATGYARGAIAEGEKLPPGVEIIAKPFEFAALGAKLGAVLRGGARSRILVVEDEALLRMSLAQDLEALGFDVEEAASAAQALENASGICAAIIDVGLPGMKGDELAAELRKRNAVLPLIIASGYGEAQIRERLSPDAFTRFLGKPYDGRQLEAALRDLGLARQALSPP
jgi:CheY-like chemotaxis protein